MSRPQSLTIVAKTLAVAALALCSAAAFSQSAFDRSRDSAGTAGTCPALLCNCVLGSEIACRPGSCTPTYGCGPSFDTLCDGCK